jgi:hypothetical protein
MKRNHELNMSRRNISPRLLKAAGVGFAACALALGQSALGQSATQTLPQVHLNAEGLAPRPIEELTGTTVARYYALAWNEMASALESGRTAGLGDEFIGVAKERIARRVKEQTQAGVHVRIVDRGHNLKAVFYSTDGAAMQLFDQTQLEIQTFDGDKLLDTQTAPHEYMVLMTPGADRWYVRELQEVSAKTF